MAFTMLFFAGCRLGETGTESGPGVLDLNPNAFWQQDELMVESGIRFEPTAAMSEALEHGVDLELDVITRVSRKMGPVAHLRHSQSTRFRIRYLPLIEYWQLDRIDPDGQHFSQSFPRFWLLTEALTDTLNYPTGLNRNMLDDGDWQVQIRAQFDRSALPSPMHLPTLFSPEWRLTGPWHTWQYASS